MIKVSFVQSFFSFKQKYSLKIVLDKQSWVELMVDCFVIWKKEAISSPIKFVLSKWLSQINCLFKPFDLLTVKLVNDGLLCVFSLAYHSKPILIFSFSFRKTYTSILTHLKIDRWILKMDTWIINNVFKFEFPIVKLLKKWKKSNLNYCSIYGQFWSILHFQGPVSR